MLIEDLRYLELKYDLLGKLVSKLASSKEHNFNDMVSETGLTANHLKDILTGKIDVDLMTVLEISNYLGLNINIEIGPPKSKPLKSSRGFVVF